MTATDETLPGGFTIDGGRYSLDTGTDPSSPGDISKALKTTLASYLSKVTLGKEDGSKGTPNAFTVTPEQTDLTLSDKNGNPTQLDGTTGGANSFAPNPPAPNNPQIQDSTSSDFVQFKSDYKKGKSSSSATTDGNSLLQNITNSDGSQNTNSIANKYTSAVLKNNRFTSAASFANNVNLDSPVGFDPVLANQDSLGTYDNGNTNSSNTQQSIAMGRLAQIGPILSARAALKLGSTDAGANFNSVKGSAESLLPGAAQIGTSMVRTTLLTAKDVLSSLTSDEVPANNYTDISSDSWGSFNTTEDPWSGISAIGVGATSAALTAALLLVIDGLSFVLNLITPGSKQPTKDSIGRYGLGSYYGSAKQSNSGDVLGAVSSIAGAGSVGGGIGAMLGITPTMNPFSQCIITGANAFFGIPDNNVGSQLLGAVTSAFGPDAGFHAIIARTIIRSADTIVAKISKIAKDGNPIDAAEQILGLVDVLRSSKIIAACNVFAQLGDSILSVSTSDVAKDTISGVVKVSSVDNPNSPYANSSRSNRLVGELKLGWASNRAQTLLLVPSQIVQSAKSMGVSDKYTTVGSMYLSLSKSSVGQTDGSNRISTDDVALLEQQLEAQYMPFYFHDLRTNEIIGFHAFMASLGDAYTPSYETIEGIGRIDPVKIYKHTHRKIDMSFYVVATSLEDFDDMWVKINKLVTLVYPQYTAGTQLQNSDGTYQFTQPFSQLVGASPLVRIRLGDLFRSNYSKFALARLFGLGNSTFMLDGVNDPNVNSANTAQLSQYPDALQQMLNYPSGETWIPDGQAAVADVSNSPLPVPAIPGASTSGPYAPVFHQFNDFFMIKVVAINGRQLIGEVQFNDDVSVSDATKKLFTNPSEQQYNFVGGKYLFSPGQLTPTNATQKKAVATVATNSQFSTNLATFMDDGSNNSTNANSVVKSFRDTGGKGLAGVIEGLSFDWHDNVLWEITTDRKAPQMCKVTISFAPIHDISPGIDSYGYNRAPLYPVGRMATQLSAPSTNSSTSG